MMAVLVLSLLFCVRDGKVLSEGWATPLSGFMRERQFLECMHFRHVTNNGLETSMAVPVVCPVTSEQKAALQGEAMQAKQESTSGGLFHHHYHHHHHHHQHHPHHQYHHYHQHQHHHQTIMG
jgi:hypothetical protein